MTKKRVLISGATGLVGSNLVRSLGKDYEIYALVRTIPARFDDNVIYHQWRVEDETLFNKLPSNIDAVIHLAQSSKMREFPLQALDIFNVNLKLTALLLDYGKRAGATHFVFASTGGIYGAQAEPFSEESPVKIPEGTLKYYFQTKYASENLISAYANDMIVQILRPFFIYGSGQKSNMLLPRLVESVRQGVPITLHGDNGIEINPVHVSDVVKLIEFCLAKNQSLTINVAGPEILSIRKISESIGNHLGKMPEFILSSEKNQNILAKNDLMESILQQPLVRFGEGVLDIL